MDPVDLAQDQDRSTQQHSVEVSKMWTTFYSLEKFYTERDFWQKCIFEMLSKATLKNCVIGLFEHWLLNIMQTNLKGPSFTIAT